MFGLADRFDSVNFRYVQPFPGPEISWNFIQRMKLIYHPHHHFHNVIIFVLCLHEYNIV
jgi:hypothetical protein